MPTNYQTEEWHKVFRNLSADIKSQQCVLLLALLLAPYLLKLTHTAKPMNAAAFRRLSEQAVAVSLKGIPLEQTAHGLCFRSLTTCTPSVFSFTIKKKT
ncbi:MAG: hypothetical protein HC817_02975 [Saprospiraceae bacterium]|nr:hypothetical protein [Saprospiraceae bacterium]